MDDGGDWRVMPTIDLVREAQNGGAASPDAARMMHSRARTQLGKLLQARAVHGTGRESGISPRAGGPGVR